MPQICLYNIFILFKELGKGIPQDLKTTEKLVGWSSFFAFFVWFGLAGFLLKTANISGFLPD